MVVACARDHPRTNGRRSSAGHPSGAYLGRPGLDKPCDACESIIAREDTEFEVDFVDQTLRMHAGCHIVWQRERDCRADRKQR